MRRQYGFLYFIPVGCVIASVFLFIFAQRAAAMGAAFTYQGRLSDAGQPATGNYDFTFRLYDAWAGGTQIGPTLTNSTLVVSNGYFSATLDFGAQGYDGTDLWLELAVRTNAVTPGGFVTLTPRQPLTPAPYAITAGQALSFSGGVSNNIAAIAQAQAQTSAAAVISTNKVTVTFSGFVSGSGTGSNNIAITLAPSTEGSNYMSGVASTSIASASANDLADGLTINAGRFPYTFAFAANNWNSTNNLETASPMHVLVLGDSLAELIPLDTAFQDNFGCDGYVAGPPLGANFTRAGAWSTNLIDFTKWFAPLTRLTNGDSVRFSVQGISPFLARSIEVPYLVNASYGKMVIRLISGGITSNIVAIDTAAGATTSNSLQLTNIDLGSRIMTEISIQCTNGVVYFPPPGFNSRMQPGVTVCNASLGGRSWTDWTNMTPAYLASVGAALKPCLIVVQETSDSNAWMLAEGVITNILNGWSRSDVLVATPNPWDFPGTPAENLVINENTVMKGLAVKHGWVLWDEHKFFGSRTNMVLSGYSLAGDPHPTAAAKLIAARAMFQATGLSALTSRGQNSGNLIYGANSSVLADGTQETSPGVMFDSSGSSQWSMWSTLDSFSSIYFRRPDGGYNFGMQVTSGYWDFVGPYGNSILRFDPQGNIQMEQTTINSWLEVANEIIDRGDFTCDGKASLMGDASVGGSLSVAGGANLGSTTVSSLLVTGSIGPGLTTIAGSLDVGSAITCHGDASVLGGVSIDDVLEVNGPFTSYNTATFENQVDMNDRVNIGLGLTCNGIADFGGGVSASGPVNVGGSLTSTNGARFLGGITNSGITRLNNTNLIITSVDNPNIAVRIYCNSNGVVMGQIVSP